MGTGERSSSISSAVDNMEDEGLYDLRFRVTVHHFGDVKAASYSHHHIRSQEQRETHAHAACWLMLS